MAISLIHGVSSSGCGSRFQTRAGNQPKPEPHLLLPFCLDTEKLIGLASLLSSPRPPLSRTSACLKSKTMIEMLPAILPPPPPRIPSPPVTNFITSLPPPPRPKDGNGAVTTAAPSTVLPPLAAAWLARITSAPLSSLPSSSPTPILSARSSFKSDGATEPVPPRLTILAGRVTTPGVAWPCLLPRLQLPAQRQSWRRNLMLPFSPPRCLFSPLPRMTMMKTALKWKRYSGPPSRHLVTGKGSSWPKNACTSTRSTTASCTVTTLPSAGI